MDKSFRDIEDPNIPLYRAESLCRVCASFVWGRFAQKHGQAGIDGIDVLHHLEAIEQEIVGACAEINKLQARLAAHGSGNDQA